MSMRRSGWQHWQSALIYASCLLKPIAHPLRPLRTVIGVLFCFCFFVFYATTWDDFATFSGIRMRLPMFFFLGQDWQEPIIHMFLMQSWEICQLGLENTTGIRIVMILKDSPHKYIYIYFCVTGWSFNLHTHPRTRSKSGNSQSPKPLWGAAEPWLQRTDGQQGIRDLVLVEIRWIGWEVWHSQARRTLC